MYLASLRHPSVRDQCRAPQVAWSLTCQGLASGCILSFVAGDWQVSRRVPAVFVPIPRCRLYLFRHLLDLQAIHGASYGTLLEHFLSTVDPKRQAPKTVLTVVRRELSSSRGICQNPDLASRVEKYFAPLSHVVICSIVGR